MESVLLVIALITLTFSLVTLLELWLGFFSINKLADQPVFASKRMPKVSIILSALNEAADIEAALLTLLKMDYPDFEVIAINDRSIDSTPAILNRLEKRYPQLRVYHLSHLPDNWLGKNHALYIGSQYAKGEWLLFTDADVCMKPDTLSHAISYVLTHGLQHLTVSEHHIRKTVGLKILLLGNYLLSSLTLKPWRIRYDWSKRSSGNGAFNLVNRKTWFDCGSHEAIPLECLDDLKLGQLIKGKGYRQDIVDGRDCVQRTWYHNLPDMIQGWEKNSFAWFGYRFLPLCLATLFIILYFIWPIITLTFCTGLVFWINIANLACMALINIVVCRHFRLSSFYAIFYPAAVCMVFYTIWNSAIKIHRKKGVIWRNTYYPLKKLRDENK